MSMTTGKQPCDNFRPQLEGNEYGTWDNLHQCPRCGKTRSFCLSCNRDHHEDGWQDCWKIKDKPKTIGDTWTQKLKD